MSYIVVMGFVAACVLAGWGYFRRWQLARPPIGVINLRDVTVTMVFIILVPLLYIALPDWAALGLLIVGIFSIVYQVFEPVLRKRWAVWLAALGLVGGNVALGYFVGTQTLPYMLVNNLTLIVPIMSIANLWAQSGMKARDAAILAALLAVYDFIFTSQLTVMGDMMNRLYDLPLAPMIVWGLGRDTLGIGFGDLLMATLFPLVMLKGYGRAAGITAMVLAILTIALLPVLVQPGTIFPVMVVLGPSNGAQYLFWRWRRGVERTTRQYHDDEMPHSRSRLSTETA